jgi:quercetin dioxygenase-like cupin family protein
MEPGARRQAVPLSRPTEEWMFALQGCFEVKVGEETYQLKSGDSLAYAGTELREFAALGDEQALVICVISPPVL